MSRWRRLGIVVCAVAAAGCGPSLDGGTRGVLESDGNPLIDFRVTAVSGGGVAVASAATRAGGRFALVAPDASGPVTLPAGSYRFTVESVGSEAKVPAAYRSADSTPLVVDWPGEGELSLNVPGLSLPGGGR